MTRVDIDQSHVLDAFVLAIRNAAMPDGSRLNEKTCFLSMYPEPYKFSDTVFVTVSPGEGKFGEGFQEGGGVHQTTEEMLIFVTIWSRHPPNQIGHDATGLVDPTRGLYSIKSKILRAICSQDLTANYPPGTQGVQQFLRNQVFAVGCTQPQMHKDEQQKGAYSFIILSFKISWDWDLTS